MEHETFHTLRRLELIIWNILIFDDGLCQTMSYIFGVGCDETGFKTIS